MSRTFQLPRVSRADFYRLKEQPFLSLLAQSFRLAAGAGQRAGLSPHQLALAAWTQILVDVRNGGFTQFFYNTRGAQGVGDAAELLEHLGLKKAADLLRSAEEVYARHAPAFATSNPWEGLFGSIAEFERLERAFSNVALRGTRLLEEWARAHIKELVADETGRPIDPTFTGAVEVLQPNGLVGQYLEVKRGKPSGAYREFFEDGSVRSVVFFKAGKLSGDYWPDGRLKRKESKKGTLKTLEWFYPSGKLQKRLVRDKTGSAVEPIELFHENGRLAEVLHMSRSDPLGPWRRFFDDGSPRIEAVYEPDRKLVVMDAWDDDRRQTVKDGRGLFHYDGRSISPAYAVFFESDWPWTGELEGGVRHGTSTTFHKGVVWSVEQFVRGERHGESTLYWDNGRIRSVTTFAYGKAGETREFPKFDRPVPTVQLHLEANQKLYEAWGHVAVDEYPHAQNLEEVRLKLTVPEFLNDVHRRNLDGTLKSSYENVSTFSDAVVYFLTVDELGGVADVRCNGSAVYSGGSWDVYPPLLRELQFTPARIRGRLVRSAVLARVVHTFVEGAGG